MMQMNQVLEYAFATLDQTVSALKGDVPGGSLERLGEPSRYLTVVEERVEDRAEPSAMSRRSYITRRSEAKPR